MSLTSCYRYILELPVDTLNGMLRVALSESDSAGINLTQHWENVPIGDKTATVDARPADLDTNPPALELAADDLAFVMQLRLRIEVDINEIPELDAIVYTIDFKLPGIFEKDVSAPPPKLMMKFPAVTEADLDLVISGGEIPLTPALIEPRIHALYDSDPSLGHDVKTGVPWPLPGDPMVMVTTDTYDDEPGSPGFRGAITVQVPDQDHIEIHIPGHFKVQGLAATYIDTDMEIIITVAVERPDGEIRVKLSTVGSGDVAVNFVNTTIYDIGAKPTLQQEIANKISSYGDFVESVPTAGEVRDLIAAQVIEFSQNLAIPVFTPEAPGPGDIDMTTFVPTTVNQQVLALQLVPLTDGTPCDVPDVFAKDTGFSVAIAAVEVQPMLDSITAANIGDHHIQGYDVTVTDLVGTLSDPGEHGQPNGHIWIDGTTEVHVDCWPDPEVDFWGPIFLDPELVDGQLIFTANAGEFGGDDPCCGDVDPAQLADLITGTQSTPVRFPQNFSGVGEYNLTVDSADIFKSGVVIHGSLAVITNHALHAAALLRTLYWFNDRLGGD
jgi:hypothetical protein